MLDGSANPDSIKGFLIKIVVGNLKTFILMEEKIQMTFIGSERSETDDMQLTMYANMDNSIYFELKQRGKPLGYEICLNRATAIKMCKELKKQIAFLRKEDENV